jgi:N-acetylglucosamine-6-phosphate deacetylase
MNITARTLNGKVCDFEIEGPVFKAISIANETSDDLPVIAPGLIDIQINGFGGIDFNRVLESEEAWQHATQQLYAHGCTGFLIAVITNSRDGYRELLTNLTKYIKRDPREHDPRNCLGFHMEGPWLNCDPGYCGAHKSEWMCKPSLDLLNEWEKITGPLVKLITMAPEVDLAASLPVIYTAVERDIAIFLGHSGATGDVLRLAIDAGAVGWTHLGNAMPATVPKFDNVALHTLASGLHASLIPDGVHLPAHAFRVFARLLDDHPSRFLLTTDAMAGAAAGKTGRYTLGEVVAEVSEDGSARLPESGRLAGSTLTPFRGVFLAQEMSGLELEKVWQAYSTRPASILNLKHGLAKGQAADFCLFTPGKEPQLLETYHYGVRKYKAA